MMGDIYRLIGAPDQVERLLWPGLVGLREIGCQADYSCRKSMPEALI
jgi:hypothetical protein